MKIFLVRTIVIALLSVSLSACASREKDRRYLGSQLAAELIVPAGLDPVETKPSYVLPAAVPLDAQGRVVGAGDQQERDIERPPLILDENVDENIDEAG